ncbi:uncharacterized protein PAN0_015d5050 [Moesziomyces antarcticus]|uniref:Uncharacterized protein n=1 Tax=Pseudozyma antarctica TaxID=84753 RepID=A0A081CJI0_PSEA2|nr:uncharacterized protein PAN0_015d5050 [Moesziomyces antarcticus]GAK66826.1 hypothetical protein PAN0_015d5050 [Moesziomyces antarcticus]
MPNDLARSRRMLDPPISPFQDLKPETQGSSPPSLRLAFFHPSRLQPHNINAPDVLPPPSLRGVHLQALIVSVPASLASTAVALDQHNTDTRTLVRLRLSSTSTGTGVSK